MGQEINLPKINPEVNREEKKRSGLAALLLRLGIGSEAGSGVGGSGALGGSGVLGRLLGAGASGGILATKAGIIGLLLVGTTVAGSLGVVAYKLFGPTAADRSGADFASVFSPKPQNSGGAGQDGSASADGVSKSLQFLADANSKPSPQEQAAQAAAVAPADASASASAAPPPLKNDNALGSTIAKLKTDRQFGALSKGAASGSGGTVSLPAGSGAGNAASLMAGGKSSSLGGMTASRAGTGSLHSLRARTLGGSAVKQLGAVRRDQTGATSSRAAGRTYDGSAITASPSGDTSAGAQESKSDKNPSVNPGGSSDGQFPSSVPSVSGTNVTPWQAAINTAMMLVMASALLLLIASKVGQMQGITLGMVKAIVCLLSVIAAGLGAWVVKLGGEIGGGQYGQPLQGGLLALAGGCIIATAAIMMIKVLGVEGSDKKVNDSVKTGKEGEMKPLTDQKEADKFNQGADGEALAKAMGGDTNLLMMCCGGAALAAMAWAYMAPKRTYSSSLFKDGRPPDYDHPYQSSQVVTPPSQGILDRYLA